MRIQNAYWRRSFEFQWVFANAAGWAASSVGISVVWLAGEVVVRVLRWGTVEVMQHLELTAGLILLLGVVAGICLGVSQWIVLRRQLGRVGRWVPASIVGCTVGWLMGVYVYAALIATVATIYAMFVAQDGGSRAWHLARRWSCNSICPAVLSCGRYSGCGTR